jgi:hypothetical protein
MEHSEFCRITPMRASCLLPSSVKHLRPRVTESFGADGITIPILLPDRSKSNNPNNSTDSVVKYWTTAEALAYT